MVARKKITDRNILAGKGQEWSKVAKEFDGIFQSWLLASELTENQFLSEVQKEEMYLTFFKDEDMALTIFHTEHREIGMPFVWQNGMGIAFESYKIETALLLFYIVGKCERQETKDKIEQFIRKELR